VSRLYLPLALVALFATVPATAQDYATRMVGQWSVTASSDRQGCFLTRDYGGPGDTSLLFGLDVDGSNRLTLLNRNWSIAPREQLKLNFRLSAGGYSNRAIGIASDGKKGFVTEFEAKFPGYFAASRALHVYRGKVPVEQLDLAGSGVAVAELRRCVDLFRDRPDAPASARERPGNIPADPFARTGN
jgi:hypothetical protein